MIKNKTENLRLTKKEIALLYALQLLTITKWNQFKT